MPHLISPPVVVCVEVGRSSRRHRHVGLNRLQDVALCWWNLDEPSEELWPQTDTHRNNLFLIGCSQAEGLKVLCSVRTEGNPLDCCFSQLQPYQMLTVELPAIPQGFRQASCAATCVYECARGRLRRLSISNIPLLSHPLSCSRHPSETTILFGLSDSSLVLYDQRRGVSLLVSCPVPPTYMAWHPTGAVAIIAGGQEELICFDVGLAPLNMALVAEEVTPAATLRLTQHLYCPGGLAGLKWATGLDGCPEGTDMLTVVFNGGPLAALRLKSGALMGVQLGMGELLQQRLRCGQVREALGILEAMDWRIIGDECYRGLSSVVNHLLRLQLNAEREAQLEAALGVFYAPPVHLSDTVIMEYREPASKYARRFFHHLLRYCRFEKAFLLAVDLGARDLFMDLHYVASDKGEEVLADVAKRKANEIKVQVIAGNDDHLNGRNGSSFSDRRAEKNQRAMSPSPSTVITQ
ncbi:WD repeat-containing and planar cell polarity effector protein fritz homolog [Nematolebias whitei]|uniref:WD repeat-containing and planar cell polarity effector protein fritz homolog n=1 Tax=Nematolebias whitei TaxID=451745 RepID=UPI00189C578C|nr:WD repeat-containing and planar cell polarity effector protein fritz homolog [Nematolebias whitei]